MAKKSGIAAPIYRIDIDAVADLFGRGIDVGDMPRKIVDQYNKDKNAATYTWQGDAEVSGCSFQLYLNTVARPKLSSWVTFFAGSGIDLGEIKSQMQHLLCFMIIDDSLYVITAGQAAAVFERFTDLSFPIDVGRRIARPEVKGAKSTQITGSNLVSDVHFRDPRRIAYSESLENVWTSLLGSLRTEILNEPDVVGVFGLKDNIAVDVGGSLKFRPVIDTPENLVRLIRWLELKETSNLPDDDGWAGFDAIKLLSARKRKDQIRHLRSQLANRIFARHEHDNIAVTNSDVSLYNNATNYVVTLGGETLHDSFLRPEVSDIVAALRDASARVPESLEDYFTSIKIRAEYSDLNSWGPSGNLISHLYGEIRDAQKTYFYLGGRWYEVDADYIDRITQEFADLISSHDLDRSAIGMPLWSDADDEGKYNESNLEGGGFSINGDKVLVNNVELFDRLVVKDDVTYVVHVKRKFDVKIRDLRSQILNSAHIIENDVAKGDYVHLGEHHTRMVKQGRVDIPKDEYLRLFDNQRVYVLAYGSKNKVTKDTVRKFRSSVARIETVSLRSQFRQIGGPNATLALMWIGIH